jgi:HTH-type transcriptional regulator/antitoxin HigA
MSTIKNEYFPETVTHPGLTLLAKLKELGMGNKEFSVRVKKPEQTITAITQGKSSITAEMAVKFEDVLKVPASFWLSRQRKYDEFVARVKRQEDIENASEWAKGFPYAKMALLGWVPKTRKLEEKVVALFNFFGISDYRAWSAYYFEQELKVNFRISLAHTNEAMAISAWLRQGERKAQEIISPQFNRKMLKDSLPSIKVLMAEHPQDFFQQLQKTCLAAGVIVLYTPGLPKAPISGSTRWLGDTPLIQLSARYKTNDKFWFTLFHEIAHILLHGKKFISLENVQYTDQDLTKEKEADDFAVKWTFSEEEEQEVLGFGSFSSHDILHFANKFNTHPAMIIGRLQRNGHLHYSEGRKFLVGIDLGKPKE